MADARIAEFLHEHGYHPRSSAHGDAICRFLLDDLVANCPAFHEAAESQRIVYELNYNVGAGGQLSWNLDLVIGPPDRVGANPSAQLGGLQRREPSEIWVAIDAKSVMTEHGKARRNRQRDLNSLHDIMHRRDSRTIVGGLIVVNMATEFQSPLRSGGPTTHRNIERLVKETVQMYADLPRREESHGSGLDAVGVVVVSHSNIPGSMTRLVTDPPAPAEASHVHYKSFLHDVCRAFTTRFANMAPGDETD